MIRYHLPNDIPVRLDIHNALGKLVATLVDGAQSQGYHRLARPLFAGQSRCGRVVHLSLEHRSSHFGASSA